MKSIKRIFCMLLACLVLLPMLASCHGVAAHEEFVMPAELDASREYEVVFWAKNDTNLTQVGVYHQAIRDFEKYYPNIHVNMKLYSNYNDIYKDVITNIPTKTTPNVCITYPDHIATYMTGKNTVVPLDALIADTRYGLGGSAVNFDAPTKEEVVPKFLEEGMIGGEQYALPFMRSTEACYINKNMVEKLGYTVPDVLTWDFIFEVSAAAMEKDEAGYYKVNGQKVLIPFIYKSTDNMMIQMLKQRGAGYSTADGTIEIFNSETENILYTVSKASKSGSFSTFKIKSYPGDYLNMGQCIFAIDSTAGATWMGTDAPQSDIKPENVVEFETVVRPIPQYDTENLQMISQGPSICLFNKEDPQEVLASWIFMQFLLTDDIQIDYAQTEGYVPVTLKAQATERYVDYLSRSGEDNELYYDVKLDATKLLLDHTEDTFITPVFNGSANLRNAAGQMIEEVVKGNNRKKTVDDAFLDALYKEMSALYKLDSHSLDSASKQDFGILPTESIVLIAGVGVLWIGIGGYVIFKKIETKTKKMKK